MINLNLFLHDTDYAWDLDLVLVIVADPQPSIIYWGQNPAVSIYNEAYTHLVGQKHPGLMGQDPKVHFAGMYLDL